MNVSFFRICSINYNIFNMMFLTMSSRQGDVVGDDIVVVVVVVLELLVLELVVVYRLVGVLQCNSSSPSPQSSAPSQT